jgi:cold shock protein
MLETYPVLLAQLKDK